MIMSLIEYTYKSIPIHFAGSMELRSSVPSGCGGKTRTCTIQLMRLTSDLRFAPHCVGCFLFRCLLQTQLIREWLNNLTLTGHLTVMYTNCTNILSSAGSGTRTHTVFLPSELKSDVPANFTIPA